MTSKEFEVMRKAQKEQSKIDVLRALDKVRAEVYDIEEPDHDFEGFYYCFEKALKIIDDNISELTEKDA